MGGDLEGDTSPHVGGGALQSPYAVARAHRRAAQRRRAHRVSGWERVRMLLVPKHLGVDHPDACGVQPSVVDLSPFGG